MQLSFASTNVHLSRDVTRLVPRQDVTRLAHPPSRLHSRRSDSFTCKAAKRGGGKAPKKQGKTPQAKTKQLEREKAPDSAPPKDTSTRRQTTVEETEPAAPPQQDGQAPSQAPEPEQPTAEAPAQPAAEPERVAVQQDQPTAESPEQTPADLMRQLQQSRKGGEQQPNLITGTLQEIQMIDWPTASSALLNTVLVIGIVGGCSLLLFAVNSLLAEGSSFVYSSFK